MRRISVLLGILFVLICFKPATAAMAPEEMAKMEALSTRIAELEAKLVTPADIEEAEAPVVGGIELSGGISTSSVWNFDSPDDRRNALRVFDGPANTANVDLVEVVVSKDWEDLGVGGRVDLDFLETSEVITAAGTTRDDIDVQQAYIWYTCPMTNITFKTGKFVTMHGAEVIEPWDNWNFSRGFLFGYAIPFTHTGIMGSYVFNDMVSTSLGVVNGWDNVEDNNTGKSFHGNLTLTPVSWATFAINGMVGPEQEDENGNLRGLLDLVLTVKPEPMPKLTLMFNYDYGTEGDVPVFAEDVLTGETFIASSADATWQGFAAYAKYDLTEKVNVALRGEWFDDEDGARTGAAQELWEITLTGTYMISDDLMARLEYRHDDSDGSPFLDGDTATDTQNTISTEMIYRI